MTTLTEVFRAFSSVVRQMPGENSQRRGAARTLSNYLFVLFYILFVCKCVLPSGDNPNVVNKYINISITANVLFRVGIEVRNAHLFPLHIHENCIEKT